MFIVPHLRTNYWGWRAPLSWIFRDKPGMAVYFDVLGVFRGPCNAKPWHIFLDLFGQIPKHLRNTSTRCSASVSILLHTGISGLFWAHTDRQATNCPLTPRVERREGEVGIVLNLSILALHLYLLSSDMHSPKFFKIVLGRWFCAFQTKWFDPSWQNFLR